MRRSPAWLLAFAAVGCRGPAQPSVAPPLPTAAAQIPDERSTGPSRAGFVVFGSEESVIVPLDPNGEVQRYPAWAIGHTDGRFEVSIPVHQVAPEMFLALPYCADDSGCARNDAGFEVFVRYDLLAPPATPGPGPAHISTGGPECTCIVEPGLSDERGFDDEERRNEALAADDETFSEFGEESNISYAEYTRDCLDGGIEPLPVSVVGGAAYHLGEYNGASCGGGNVYTLGGGTTLLRAGAPGLGTFKPGRGFQCTPEVPDSSPIVSFVTEADEDALCDYGEADCALANEDATAVALFNGALVRLVGDIGPMGGDPTSCFDSTPVSPEHCPSVFDPCGDPSVFPQLPESGAWWVATNGSAALSVDEGTLRVFRPGVENAIREVSGMLPLDGVIGVEFHPHVPQTQHPIPQAIGLLLPEPAAAPVTSWGDACFAAFKAGDLEQAEAACAEGLIENADTDDHNARGALLYSMGRIEEARGALDRARAFYRRSLVLRPGNAAVQRRLNALL